MKSGGYRLWKLFIVLYLAIVHVVAGYFIVREFRHGFNVSDAIPVLNDPTLQSPVPTPIPVPSTVSDLSPDEPASTGEQLSAELLPQSGELDLIVPVKGVRPDQLTDTFDAARGEGRSHDAIDIIAPEGTPVVAAADGVIARFFDSVPGGITIYQFTANRKYMLYYGHLQKRAENLKPGDQVTRGQLIGYVGDTGNSGKGNFHLHFSVALIRDPARYWEGDYLNPFPILRRSPVK